jgi:flagellin
MSRIQTNVAALNAHRNLASTGSKLSKSIAKLSSGFRINRAVDDAAGLGIANQLRSDTRAMRQASRNGAQANAVLSIADGAVSTLTTMVDRMKELATQSASDNVSDAQRLTLNDEYTTLLAEFDRISDTTVYQGKSLLDGTFGSTSVLNSTGTVTINSTSESGTAAGTYTVAEAVGGTVTMSDGNGTVQSVTVADTGADQTVEFDAFGITLSIDEAYAAANGDIAGTVTVSAGDAEFLVSVSGQEANLDKISMTSIDVRTDELSISGTVITSNSAATTVIGLLDTAIGTLASAVGTIGAAQSQIDFAMTSLSVTIENTAAAESVIRDADMAFEMIDFTKQQILQQAGVAMLAQANSAPQGVLSLLAG